MPRGKSRPYSEALMRFGIDGTWSPEAHGLPAHVTYTVPTKAAATRAAWDFLLHRPCCLEWEDGQLEWLLPPTA
jgi:hypothetical protein